MSQYTNGTLKFLTNGVTNPMKNVSEAFKTATIKKPGWNQITDNCEKEFDNITECEDRVINSEIGEVTEWNDLEVRYNFQNNTY